jgi:hypothetical protein
VVQARTCVRFMAYGVRLRGRVAVVVPSAPRSHAVSAQDLESLDGLVKECARVITVSALNNVARLRVGKIPDTQFPNSNYLNPDPKYPNPKYPITISDSDCKNPKLVWVIRVMFPGTRTTQITRNISNICSSISNMKT